VLGALQSGASKQELRVACGVTCEQLAKWQRDSVSRSEPHARSEQSAQVFTVVDEMAEQTVEQPTGQPPRDLELRLGEWAICIRRLEA
jgi:hypothetical protein